MTIQKPTVGSDSEGSPKTVWSTLDRVWAKIEPLSARERLMAAQAELDVTDSVTIDYRTDVTHNMRLLYGSRILEIQEVIPDEARHVDLQLLCQELIV